MKNQVTTEDRVQALKLARAFRGVVLPPRHLADEWTTREAPLPVHFADMFEPLVNLAQALADARASGLAACLARP